MTKGELSTILYDLNVPADLYRLDGQHYELAWVLDEQPDAWTVFLSERGGSSSPRAFTSEHEACTYFFGCIALDLVQRKRLRVSD